MKSMDFIRMTEEVVGKPDRKHVLISPQSPPVDAPFRLSKRLPSQNSGPPGSRDARHER
jgi:hypothetical protein